MAAKKDDKAPAEDAPEPSGSKLPLLTFVLLVLNLGATGFVAYMALFPVAPPAPPPPPPAADEKNSLVGPLVDLEAFLVNLNEEKSSSYLRTKLQLEVEDQATADMVEKAKPILRSELLGYLSSLTVAETRGAEAKEKINADVLKLINDRIGSAKAKRLFFTEFVVQ